MLITAASMLILMGALLQGLRNGFYVLHVLTACGVAYLYGMKHPGIAPFSPDALWAFFVIHLIGISVWTFCAYGYDKAAARNGKWRVKEKALHAMTFIGGTFGAFAAQKVFRHKTRKTGFRIVFWLTGWLQVVLIYVFWAMSR